MTVKNSKCKVKSYSSKLKVLEECREREV